MNKNILKNVFTILFLFGGFYAFAQTTAEMNAIAEQLYADSDRELNLVYNQIRTRYSNDPLLLQKLRNAQLIWIQFRDATIEACFPAEDKIGSYGSIWTSEMLGILTQLTRDRTRQLREFYL